MDLLSQLPQEIYRCIILGCQAPLQLAATNSQNRRLVFDLLANHYAFSLPQYPGWELIYTEKIVPQREAPKENNDPVIRDKRERLEALSEKPKTTCRGTSRFMHRKLPTASKPPGIGTYPFVDTVTTTPEQVTSFDHVTKVTSNTIIPEGIKGLNDLQTEFDARHDEYVISTGRYCHVPVTHPLSVTDGNKIIEQTPTVEGIRCLFFMSTKPVLTLKRLDMHYCVNDSYVICTKSLGSAVYECGKSDGSFRSRDKGVGYLIGLCPNLAYLKLSFPHVVWSDASAPRSGGMDLDGKSGCRVEVFEQASKLEHLQYLCVESFAWDSGPSIGRDQTKKSKEDDGYVILRLYRRAPTANTGTASPPSETN